MLEIFKHSDDGRKQKVARWIKEKYSVTTDGYFLFYLWRVLVQFDNWTVVIIKHNKE